MIIYVLSIAYGLLNLFWPGESWLKYTKFALLLLYSNDDLDLNIYIYLLSCCLCNIPVAMQMWSTEFV